MDFHPRVLCATPSYALVLAEVAAQQGVDLRNSGLAIGMFGAEPWSAAMREEIETRIGLRAVDIYGLSEIMGPGVACECACRSGLHGWEDHFLFEVIDPDTGAVLGDGEVGELVITTLTKEALPMLRYRTRDITRLCRKRCDCGRTHTRILRLTGRSDDMLIIRGVNVYPSQIEAVLVGRAGLSPNYQIEVSRDGVLDRLRCRCGAPRQVDDRRQRRAGGVCAGQPAALAGQGGARARSARQGGCAVEAAGRAAGRAPQQPRKTTTAGAHAPARFRLWR